MIKEHGIAGRDSVVRIWAKGAQNDFRISCAFSSQFGFVERGSS